MNPMSIPVDPACGAGSTFSQPNIGMPVNQVTDVLSKPADQDASMTGKAWNPWYLSSDKHRHERVCKGQGRLNFGGPAGFSYGQGNPIWIIHKANEAGYR